VSTCDLLNPQVQLAVFIALKADAIRRIGTSRRLPTVTFQDKERILSSVLALKRKWYKPNVETPYFWDFPGCARFYWDNWETFDPIQVST
jgi:hypothetical protein